MAKKLPCWSWCCCWRCWNSQRPCWYEADCWMGA